MTDAVRELGMIDLPFVIRVVDVVAAITEQFGSRSAAESIAGRELPESEHRFVITGPTGQHMTFNLGATANDVINYAKSQEWL